MLAMTAVLAGWCGWRLVLCAFVYRDASAKGADAMSWLGLVSVLGIIGLVVWLVSGPRPAPVPPPQYAYYPAPVQPPPAGYIQPPVPGPPAWQPPPPGQYPPPWLPPYLSPPLSGAPQPASAGPAFRPFAVRRMLATFLAAMFVTLFIELPLAFLVVALGFGASTDPAAVAAQLFTPGMLLLLVAIQDAVLVGFTYIAMFRPGHLTLKDIGATAEAHLPRGATIGFIAGLALFAVASGLVWLLERTGWFGTGEDLIQVGTPSGLILTLVATVVIAPPAEELFFRAYALPVLERKWGASAAIFLSALMFSVAHGSLIQIVPIFFAGVILAMLFRKWGIVPCVTAHAVNNALAVVLLYLGFG